MNKHLGGDLAVIGVALIGAAVLSPLITDSIARLFLYVGLTVAAAVVIGVRAERDRRRARHARGTHRNAA